MNKATVDEIRQRFDHDVERFSNLETGQSSTIDAPLMLELIARAAAETTPGATRLLDVGCGAGNYTLKLLQYLPAVEPTLIDLSRPMLDRAAERIGATTTNRVELLQGDVRELDLGQERYDLIVAAAVLHHLRSEAEWRTVFETFYAALRPGGSLWISDLIDQSIPAVRRMMWERYGDYLTELEDESYRAKVFAYIEREDTPYPLIDQLNLLRAAGFEAVDILHKNSLFAAFGAVKAPGTT